MYRATEPDMSLWQGRVDDADGGAALRWHQVVRAWDGVARFEGAPALLGFACDAGIRRNGGREGAAQGPRELRRLLGNSAAHDMQVLYDAGDVACAGDALEPAQGAFADRVAALLDAGANLITLGGGHEIAWASFMGLVQHLSGQVPVARIGLLNFDAHFDMRCAKGGGNSGTPYRQIAAWCAENNVAFNYRAIGISALANTAALYDAARASGAQWIEDGDCVWHELPRMEAFVDSLIEQVDVLHLSVCLDVFDAASAPGVSAPAGLGVDPKLVLALIRHVGLACRRKGVRWMIGEVAEFSPRFDSADRTARLAARLSYEILRAKSNA